MERILPVSTFQGWGMHRPGKGVKWGCQSFDFQRLLLYTVCDGSCAAACTSKVSWLQIPGHGHFHITVLVMYHAPKVSRRAFAES